MLKTWNVFLKYHWCGVCTMCVLFCCCLSRTVTNPRKHIKWRWLTKWTRLCTHKLITVKPSAESTEHTRISRSNKLQQQIKISTLSVRWLSILFHLWHGVLNQHFQKIKNDCAMSHSVKTSNFRFFDLAKIQY